ncbi:hypothetical protein C8R46DRAFT_1025187 [Mycena filopes]|nr:hypothetical protein C8R46DRAFT_1025187 [Mycena filopes]
MSTTLFFAIGLFLCISATLNVVALFQLHQTSAAYASPDNAPLPSELPLTVNPAVLEFVFGVHYNITNAAEWATLVPPHQGRVRLPVNGEEEEEGEFDVGMYTDLRCLDTIRAAYVQMRDGASVRAPDAEACLGHIRQAVLCAADITLEPAHLSCAEDAGVCPVESAVATGRNVEHRCRDWVQVQEYVERNQAGWVVK